jgi:ATP-dependent helicase/nuclease subunit B
MPSRHAILCSPRAADRLEAASRWLGRLEPSAEVMVLAQHGSAADDLVRELSTRRALFGVYRMTPARLLGALCSERLFHAGLVPASALSIEAIAARAIQKLTAAGELGYFAPVADRPGFPGALARTLIELRLAKVEPDRLAALDTAGPPLAAMLRQYEAELREAHLLDRAGVLDLAAEIVRSDPAPHLATMPTLMLDVALASRCERDFYAALAARANAIFATVAQGDEKTLAILESALAARSEISAPSASSAGSIFRLQDFLFGSESPAVRALDDTVELVSAPGEMQECVEIARRILREARAGVPFDRIAVALRAPARYVPYLEEAFDRAGIPGWFARGAARPEPGGRALLELLACAAEHLSARRYAEYLSLAQVPDPEHDNSPQFVAPDLEIAGAAAAPQAASSHATPEASDAVDAGDPVPVVDGALRAPWRWERLLVDASVIGSAERWKRRLDGLQAELEARRTEIIDDEMRTSALDRQLLDLKHLRSVAMPQIAALGALPSRATWGEWLAHLRALTTLAIRDSAPVMAAIAELEPMGPVGPVGLDEVRQVLAERLGRLEAPLPRRRYGAVMVAPAHDLRGHVFDVVIVPGLTERVFPQKLIEDPILPDAARLRLGAGLELQQDRVTSERLGLRVAAGAARNRLMFSFPRVDLDQGRPRVPSFYALEVLRAAEGRLPGFDELNRQTARGQTSRLGWPAPREPGEAIDDAEFDLAVLNRLEGMDAEATVGAAHYLLHSDPPHLARALRARARRWLKRWTPADGLVDPQDEALAALGRHRLDARSYSATALQQFAACPYRFLLYAIHRIQPREEAEAIEVIDPLTRGALLHEIQFELLTRLRAAGCLPVTQPGLDGALAVMDATLEGVAAGWHDRLAPAIERVWKDAVDAIRADLREWLRRAAEDPIPWTPERFELAFGLQQREQADPASQADPVPLEAGITLRGSIDLVERGLGGRLRITDHKSGRADAPKDLVIGGGRVLQPVLYALAAERLLGEPVESGRLYYCSSRGSYEERVVPLDDSARAAAREFASIVGGALARGFLPAAPVEDGCQRCDYRRVCGPYEETRVAQKPQPRLASLERLRTMR